MCENNKWIIFITFNSFLVIFFIGMLFYIRWFRNRQLKEAKDYSVTCESSTKSNNPSVKSIISNKLYRSFQGGSKMKWEEEVNENVLSNSFCQNNNITNISIP